MYAELVAQRGDFGTVALVQDPGVVGIIHGPHRVQRLGEHVDRLGAGDERCHHGDFEPRQRGNRQRPAHAPEEEPPGEPCPDVE